MRSSSSPKPISIEGMSSRVWKCPATGIEPPEPMKAASVSHSAESASRAASKEGREKSITVAPAPPWGCHSTVQSSGSCASTKARSEARIFSGSWRETSRQETLAKACAGITVLKPSPS